GLAPVQRDGLEYEFDVVADMDGAELVVTKTRCPAIQKAVIIEPGEKLGETLGAWLTDGVPLEPPPPPPTPAQHNPNAVVGFGGAKGRKVSELSDLELADAIDLANLKLREEPSARWAKAMRDNLLFLEAELVHRAAGGSQPPDPTAPAPEPGQAG
ncbi:hypothetical protein LXT21_44705, partial [Myxococcus sp. K38C18041901]|nr:hypothetical protein [Myxococcus guangdongensis]